MRKELIWAGVIGISFGLIIAFGAWRINSSLQPKTPAATPAPIPATGEVGLSIAFNKPENGDVVTTSTVTVSGITESLVWLTFSGEKGDYILQAGEDGVFSQDIGLTSGVNQIKVTAIDSTGNQTSQNLLIVYSALFQLNAGATPSATLTNATSDAAIAAGVAGKVAAALNQPKAYLGTVTDIADSTIQIKSLESQIEQIDISGTGISVVNTKDSDNKTVKLTDIGIGDFIVAMGYINQNSVLAAQRILVTNPVLTPEINVSIGKVTDVSQKTLTVSDVKSGSNSTLTPDIHTDLESYTAGKATAIKIAGIAGGDTVIYFTDQSGTPPILRSVFDVGTPQG